MQFKPLLLKGQLNYKNEIIVEYGSNTYGSVTFVFNLGFLSVLVYKVWLKFHGENMYIFFN